MRAALAEHCLVRPCLFFGPGGTGQPVAVFTTTSLTGGTHNIVAAYQGDGNYLAATSTSVPLTINARPVR